MSDGSPTQDRGPPGDGPPGGRGGGLNTSSVSSLGSFGHLFGGGGGGDHAAVSKVCPIIQGSLCACK